MKLTRLQESRINFTQLSRMMSEVHIRPLQLSFKMDDYFFFNINCVKIVYEQMNGLNLKLTLLMC